MFLFPERKIKFTSRTVTYVLNYSPPKNYSRDLKKVNISLYSIKISLYSNINIPTFKYIPTLNLNIPTLNINIPISNTNVGVNKIPVYLNQMKKDLKDKG